MNADTINAIKEAFVPIAEKIGQGAAYGWDVVVLQQYVNAVGSFIAAVMFLVAGVVVWRFANNTLWNTADENPGWFMGILVAMVAFGFSAGCLYDTISHVINPYYYALEFFITLGKSAL